MKRPFMQCRRPSRKFSGFVRQSWDQKRVCSNRAIMGTRAGGNLAGENFGIFKFYKFYVFRLNKDE